MCSNLSSLDHLLCWQNFPCSFPSTNCTQIGRCQVYAITPARHPKRQRQSQSPESVAPNVRDPIVQVCLSLVQQKNQESSQLEPNVAKRELDPHLKHQGVNTLTEQRQSRVNMPGLRHYTGKTPQMAKTESVTRVRRPKRQRPHRAKTVAGKH